MEPKEGRYIVSAFVQACKVMGAFRRPGEALALSEIVMRTSLQKGTVFRLLYTLHQEGFLEKTPRNQYRLRITLPKKSRLRFGYSGNEKDPFTRTVTESLGEAAAIANIEVVCLNNNASDDLALENAEMLVGERVDLAIVFFGNHSISDVLSSRFLRANIPMIAIDVPLTGATYFGADNYQAGLIAGRYMSQWARSHWKEVVPAFVLIGYRRAGSLVGARIRGMLAGIEEHCKPPKHCRFVTVDSIGDYLSSYEAVMKYLKTAPACHTIIGAVNDQAALGAIGAFEQAGQGELCAAMGHNAEWDARAELRRPGTRLIGTVAYFPENYGAAIIGLARRILAGAHVPPAVMTKHVLLTAQNLDKFYGNDALIDLPALNEKR